MARGRISRIVAQRAAHTAGAVRRAGGATVLKAPEAGSSTSSPSPAWPCLLCSTSSAGCCRCCFVPGLRQLAVAPPGWLVLAAILTATGNGGAHGRTWIVYNMCIVYRGAIRQTFCVLVIIRILFYYLFIVYFVLPHPACLGAAAAGRVRSRR